MMLQMSKKINYKYTKNNSIRQYIAKANGDLLVSTDRKLVTNHIKDL